jgi:hypothetical protein
MLISVYKADYFSRIYYFMTHSSWKHLLTSHTVILLDCTTLRSTDYTTTAAGVVTSDVEAHKHDLH